MIDKLMDGVEVLSKTPIKEIPNVYSMTVVIILGIIFVCGIIFSVVLSDMECMWLTFMSMFIVFVIFTGFSGLAEKETGKYTYKVTIDDSVNYNEFADKYNVTEKDGKIYTITLKGE